MALPKYRVNSTTGSVVNGRHFPCGSIVETKPGEPPRESWTPLNAEATAAFTAANRTSKKPGTLHT